MSLVEDPGEPELDFLKARAYRQVRERRPDETQVKTECLSGDALVPLTIAFASYFSVYVSKSRGSGFVRQRQIRLGRPDALRT